MNRRHGGDLGPDRFGGLDAEVGAQAQGEFGGDHPVGAGGARRGDLLLGDTHATLEVREGAVDLGRCRSGQDEVGVGKGRGVGQHLDGDHRAGTGKATLGQVGIGHIAQRIAAEQDEHVEITRAPPPAWRWCSCPPRWAPDRRRRNRHSAALAREQARGHTHVEGAVHIAATQRRQETDAFESVEGDGCIDGDRRGLGDRGPAEDHRDRTRIAAAAAAMASAGTPAASRASPDTASTSAAARRSTSPGFGCNEWQRSC